MPKITFARTGQTYEVEPGTSFLEFSQRENAPHDFGCTVGSCGTCVCTVEPADAVNPIGEEERETVEMCSSVEGARLGCQLVVNADVTVRPAE